MSNQENLLRILSSLGENPSIREIFIDVFHQIENILDLKKSNVRDEITGPLIDALHANIDVLKIELNNGIFFEFLYRSKIARDLVMAVPERPDHVWEPQTTRLLLELSKQSKHVVVGGAYFGDQAILIAHQIANNNGVCHCFEINSDQFNMLERNIQINKINNILAWKRGLWDNSNSFLKLVGEDSFAHPELVENSFEGCQTISIDEYAEEENINFIDLIMLDMEGAEFNALKGAYRFLSKPVGQAPNIVFEIHRNYVDWSDGLEKTNLVGYLIELGYILYAIRDFNSNVNMRGYPIEIIPISQVYLEGPPHGFNVVGVKDNTVFCPDKFCIENGVSPKLLWHKSPNLHHPRK